MRPTILVLAGLAAVALGCRHVPTCPTEGGAPWLELTTPHARVYTDLDRLPARLFAYFLEAQWQFLAAAAWPDLPPSKTLLEVVVLRDGVELYDYSRRAGLYVAPGFHPGFVLTYGEAHLPGTTLRHELAHAQSHRASLGLAAPRWFVEGLACFLETIDYDFKDSVLTYGDGHRHFYDHAVGEGLLDFDELWRPYTDSNMLKFYATSWLLTHYLFNHRAQDLAEFQRGLGARGASARAVWDKVFPDLAAPVVNARLVQYLNAGKFHKTRTPMVRPDFDIETRPLPDSQIHAVMALVSAVAPQLSPAARRELAAQQAHQALRENPSDLLAQEITRLLLGENRGDLAGAQRLVREHPGAGGAWAILASCYQDLGRKAEAVEALAHARQLGFPADEAEQERILPPLPAP